MKIISYFHSMASVLMIAAAVTAFTSCSSDDGGGESSGGKTTLTDPEFEEESVCYEITSGSSDLQSIELTSSGDYIIVTNGGVRSSQAYSFSDFLPIAEGGTRDANHYSDIITGKYTKASDTEYILEGFGRIEITGGTSSATSLKISPDGELPYTLTAKEKNTMEGSQKTSWLCRTWEFSAFKMKIVMEMDKKSCTVINGKYKLTEEEKFRKDIVAGMKKAFKTFYPEQYAKAKKEADKYAEDAASGFKFDSDGRPEQIIFTKAGTYMVTYKGDRLGVATWSWENEAEGLLRYSWNYDISKQGTAEIGFYGNQLTIKEANDKTSQDFIGSVELIWFMDEVK